MPSKGKILVVDDDPLLRSLLVDTLSAIGYDSTAASDGVEALTILREQNQSDFDLVITDIKMPRMDGLTLTKKIRRACPLLPVLFITGVVSEETMAAAAPDGYLSKPFRIELLENLIEKTLTAARTGRRPTPPRRVLISVPQDELRESLANTLMRGNYLPFAVAGGDEAMEELQRGRFDAVIAGIDTMSDTDTSFLDQFRRTCPELPLVLTGPVRPTEDREGTREKLRAVGWLPCPFEPDDLIALLDRTFDPDEGPHN